jgi:hypothetical protein
MASSSTASLCRPLGTALTPHVNKFKAIYRPIRRPIRHKYFAHRGTESQQAIEALFSKILKTDVAEILGFLHTLLWAIREMAWNGKKPDLGDSTDYDREVRGLTKEIEEFVCSLP